MRRDLQRLQDILEALDSVTTMMRGCSEADFLQNDTLRYAVAHRLTVVGEAASRLGADIKEKYASVPWPDIAGLRNILVHEYFGSAVIEMIATEFPE